MTVPTLPFAQLAGSASVITLLGGDEGEQARLMKTVKVHDGVTQEASLSLHGSDRRFPRIVRFSRLQLSLLSRDGSGVGLFRLEGRSRDRYRLGHQPVFYSFLVEGLMYSQAHVSSESGSCWGGS